MTIIRSSRALARDEQGRSFYARALGLRHMRLSGIQSFMLFEGSIGVGALLALAEFVDWWAVLVLPASVAAMVKFNDALAGATRSADGGRGSVARGRATVPARPHSTLDSIQPVSPAAMDAPVGSPEQRARQSATRRYG